MILGLGRFPGGGNGNPLQYSYLETPHAQRSLEGCSPWGGKDSDMTDRLSIAQVLSKGLPGGSAVKKLPANAGDTGSAPRWGRSPG